MIAPVIVAVDGSEASRHAVAWAADEAVLRGRPLEVFHASKNLPDGDGLFREEPSGVLEAAAREARERHPELAVSANRAFGEAVDFLVDASARAHLLVLGSRGLGGFKGLLLGSVSQAVAARTACPLVVVRGNVAGMSAGHRRGAVVVGVSGPDCIPALREAFTEARARQVPLRALYAWSFPEMPVNPPAASPTREAIASCQSNGETLLKDALDAVRDDFKDVEVHAEVAHKARAAALVDASDEADLVVVATHRNHTRIGRHLGPVTHALVHHAKAPVLIVPAE